jgi:hypothetical protein
MKATRKSINISIEYGDINEAIQALRKVSKQIHTGQLRYDRRMQNTALVEWSISNAEPMEYREEIINGQWCQVFQSKMNEL